MARRITAAAVFLAMAMGIGSAAAQEVQPRPAPESQQRGRVQQPPQKQTPPPPQFDVTRLPVDVDRLQRKLQEAVEREERGAMLRFTVNVFGQAPPIVLVTPDDNLVFGKSRHGAPTHSEMLNIVTPRPFSPIGGATISW